MVLRFITKWGQAMNKYISLLVFCVSAMSAHTLVIENKTDCTVQGRVKVRLMGSKGARKGSVHFTVTAGSSATLDLMQASKWLRSSTGEREFVALSIGDVSSIELVKIKAKAFELVKIKGQPAEVTAKGRVKVQSKSGIKRKDLLAASHIVIEQNGDKLSFLPVV